MPALQNFVNMVSTVSAQWLNQVDVLLTTIFQQATTNPAARAALCSDLPLEIVNGGTAARSASTALSNLGGIGPAYITSGLIGGILYPALVTEVGVVNDIYPPYNVLRYGADPTGVASSRAAFMAAYNSAMAATPHGAIYAPTGTYLIDAPGLLWNNQADIRFYGDGPNLTVLMGSNSPSYNIFTITADIGVGTSGINLNLSNFGVRNHPLAGLTNGLVIADYGYGSLTSIRVQASGDALVMSGNAFLTCTDLNLLSWESNGAGTAALALQADTHGSGNGPMTFTSCQFEGAGGVTSAAAVQSALSVAMTFLDCAFIGAGPGLISVADFTNNDDVTLIECYSEASTNTNTGGGTLFRLGLTRACNFTLIGGTFFTGDNVHQLDRALVTFNTGNLTVMNAVFAGFNICVLAPTLTVGCLIQVSNIASSGALSPPVFDPGLALAAPPFQRILNWTYPPQSTGWGTPNGAIQANFNVVPATLTQTSAAVGQLIAHLKQIGILGN